jgi:hypothetical protein
MFIALNSQYQVVLFIGLYGKPKTARMQLNNRYVTSQKNNNVILRGLNRLELASERIRFEVRPESMKMEA